MMKAKRVATRMRLLVEVKTLSAGELPVSVADEVNLFNGEYYDCSGNCLNDADGNGICDEIDALLFNEFTEGVQFGVAQCTWRRFSVVKEPYGVRPS